MVKRATETSNLLYYFGLAKLKDAQGVTLNAAFQKYGKHDETAESRQFCELFGFMQGLSEAFFCDRSSQLPRPVLQPKTEQ